ncbi:hypothetical protein LEMLEM_LOCUS16466 [Lemmus lemmus]
MDSRLSATSTVLKLHCPRSSSRSSGLGLASPGRVQWTQLEQGGAQITELGACAPPVLLEGYGGAGLTNVNEYQGSGSCFNNGINSQLQFFVIWNKTVPSINPNMCNKNSCFRYMKNISSCDIYIIQLNDIFSVFPSNYYATVSIIKF